MEYTDKSMKNALYILRYAKRHLSGWSRTVEQYKTLACSLRDMLVWTISLSVNQYKISKVIKIPQWLFEGWSKSLFLPNQFCPIIVWENWGWYLGCIISWVTPTSLLSLLWTTIVVTILIWFKVLDNGYNTVEWHTVYSLFIWIILLSVLPVPEGKIIFYPCNILALLDMSMEHTAWENFCHRKQNWVLY